MCIMFAVAILLGCVNNILEEPTYLVQECVARALFTSSLVLSAVFQICQTFLKFILFLVILVFGQYKASVFHLYLLTGFHLHTSVQFSSVAQSCPTLRAHIYIYIYNFWFLFIYFVPSHLTKYSHCLFYLLIFKKSLLNLLQYCFCFILWVFGHEVCGILALWPGIKPTLLALEGEVLTTGLSGKSLSLFIIIVSI